MATTADVVTAARSYIGSPIFHRGRSREGGIDCLGLVILAGVESGAMQDPDEASWPFAAYGRLPNPKRLIESLGHFLKPIEICELRPADVIGLSWGAKDLPMHLAIRAEFQGRASMIHALPLVKPPRVVETGYAGVWVEQTCGAWRYPGVTD
ncbi:MAG TPA: hypothetical protein VIJ94_10295 [Caulobacteraceae bacterium]